jgi:hypothetical protein
VALDVAVIRACHDFSLRAGAAEIGHFLRAFIDEENDELHLRMIFDHRISNVME